MLCDLYQVKTQWEPTLQNKKMIGCFNHLKKKKEKKVTVKSCLGGKTKRHLHPGSEGSDWMRPCALGVPLSGNQGGEVFSQRCQGGDVVVTFTQHTWWQ